MDNPFDDKSALFLVLVNDEEQYSLWPSRLDVPAGWTVAHQETDRAAAMAWVDEHWTDLSPRSARLGERDLG